MNIQIPTPGERAAQQKIIIQAFGMQSVMAANYVVNSEVQRNLTSIEQKAYDGKVPTAPTADKPLWTSALGTPIWDTLILKGDTFIDHLGNKFSYNEMRIDSVLITLSQTDNVVVTPIQGRDGEVIEYVGKGSFRINFKGGFFGGGNIRPKEEIANFALMMKSNQPISVKTCRFLTEWSITDFVVLDKTIPQNMGGYNYQLFEFNAIQDIPVILAQSNR